MVIEGEQLLATWAKLDPGKRRLVLALVRAVTEGEL